MIIQRWSYNKIPSCQDPSSAILCCHDKACLKRRRINKWLWRVYNGTFIYTVASDCPSVCYCCRPAVHRIWDFNADEESASSLLGTPDNQSYHNIHTFLFLFFFFCLKLHDLSTGNINLTPQKGFNERNWFCLMQANLSPLSVNSNLVSMQNREDSRLLSQLPHFIR